MTPTEHYRSNPAFREAIDRLAGHVAEPVSEVLRALDQLGQAHRPALPTFADLERELHGERRVRLDSAASSAFRPGARCPGHKPAPAVPPWAKKRAARPIRPLPTERSTS